MVNDDSAEAIVAAAAAPPFPGCISRNIQDDFTCVGVELDPTDRNDDDGKDIDRRKSETLESIASDNFFSVPVGDVHSGEAGEGDKEEVAHNRQTTTTTDSWKENEDKDSDGSQDVFSDEGGRQPPPISSHDDVVCGAARPADPVSNASILSRMLFLWASPLLKVGSTRPLEEEDLPNLPPEETSAHNRAIIEGLWRREKQTRANPSLLRGVLLYYVRSMAFAQVLLVLSMAARVGQALALGLLLEQFEDQQGRDTKLGYIWTGVIVLCGAVLFLSKQQQFYETYRGGMRIRIGMVASIFAKALKLSSIGGVYHHTSGQVTNLASNDVERFVTTSVSGIYLIWGPLEAVVILITGIQVIGSSFAAGYLLLLLFVPLQFYLSKRFAFLRSKVASMTDARVSIVNQAVTGARVMKMSGWENHFAKKISSAREKEVRQILKSSRCKALNESIYFCSNIVVSVLIFSVHVAMGGTLTSRNVYSTMALLNILQFTVAKQIPSALMGLAECSVSSKRVQSFLEVLDLPGVVPKQEGDEDDEVFSLVDGTCYWNGPVANALTEVEEGRTKRVSTSKHVKAVNSAKALSNVCVTLKKKGLYCVIGKVGAGKSALLQAIAGELTLASGKLHRSDYSLAYAPQDPWIMNGSIRENIIMSVGNQDAKGESWYQKVVESCGLLVDFNQLRHGDRTVVGDRGIQLSGGQRSRVGLARALFRDADVVLLDDPLSAVDTKVGRLIYNSIIECVNRGKCVVLATHQQQYAVANCCCILMDGGKVAATGSYEECGKMSSEMLDSSFHTESDASKKNSLHGDTQSEHSDSSDTCESVTVDSMTKSDATDVSHKEDRTRGIVKMVTWTSYLQALGGTWVGIGLLVLFVVTQASSLLCIVLMGNWSESEDQDSPRWFGLIVGLVLGTVVLSIIRARQSFSCCIKASQHLHDHMSHSVLRAKVEFFDTNPVGRILNRFTADVGITDELLPLTIYDFLVGAFIAVGGVATAVVVLPFILIALPMLVFVFVRLRGTFVTTTRELKRLEGVGRSPIYAMLTEALNGIATLRCNDKVAWVGDKFEAVQDAHTRAFFAFVASSRWFALRIDVVAFTLMSVASLFSVLFHDQGWFDVEPAVLGLALTMLLQLAGTNFPWITRQSAEVVNQMVSTERIHSFGSLPSEAELSKSEPDDALRAQGWPMAGAIEAKNLTVRYRQSLPVTLQSVSFRIEAGQRVGVVGRTGAGKSTLLQSLFRLLEAEDGCIMIDDVDISTVGLHTLRSSMSIIPQRPTLYSGCTLKENLDPFSDYSDEEICGVLQDVQMEAAVRQLPEGLDSMVSEEGTNLSVGQRQLLCLARAILRKTKILILDEPTANCDRRTDQQLHAALQRNFMGATVLSVAHRLETVIDHDYILVLGNGRVLEYGPPAHLLKQRGGSFTAMVDDTGSSMSKSLRQRVKIGRVD